MRTFATAALVLATAAAAAANKRVTTIGTYSDAWRNPTAVPLSSTNKWSYHPNTDGILTSGCGSGADEACGPLNWGVIASNCNPSATQQSPIDFDINEGGYTALSKASGAFQFNGFKCAAEVVAKKGTWELEFFDCPRQSSVVDASGKKWVLWQMHIHGTSEHSVDGGYYPMEVHLVHVPAGTNPVEFDPTTVPDSVLVLGVFLTVGKSNPIFSVLTKHQADELEPIAKAINPYQLLPREKSYWNYKGSLTTPVTLYSGTAHAVDLGCGAGLVNWHVFKKAVPISPAQLAWATEAISSLPLAYNGLNNRPIQQTLSTTQIKSYGKSLN